MEILVIWLHISEDINLNPHSCETRYLVKNVIVLVLFSGHKVHHCFIITQNLRVAGRSSNRGWL